VTRNRLILAGAGLFVVLFIILLGIGIWHRANPPLTANQKTLISKLGYCSSDNRNPCVVSFTQDGTGNMLVNLLVPSASFPNFYLVISRENAEIKYECEKIKGFPNSVSCKGPEMFPGEILQFTLISTRNNTVLAEGSFAIIGLLLATPDVETTEMAETIETSQPTESLTPFLLELPTPIPRATEPSYPNPSYPNPSAYPNP